MTERSALPFYFGPEDSLFGVYHRPRGGRPRDLAVVLCYPLLHEYVSSLRAFRALAADLSKRGFGVLRFDWFATGDSAGSGPEGRLSRWIDDLEHAIDYLRATHGTLRFAVIGLRAGATIATLAAARLTEIELLALWEPVERPREWLESLRREQREWLEQETQYRLDAHTLATNEELMGYALPHALSAELDAVDLEGGPPNYATRVLLLGDGDDARSFAGLRATLSSEGAEVNTAHVPGERIWGSDVGFEEALVPGQIVRALATWVEEAAR